MQCIPIPLRSESNSRHANQCCWLCAFLLVTLIVESTNAQQQATAHPADNADQATIVVMAPGGPVFCRLNILVDRQPYRLWVTKYLAGKLDVDGNGELTLEEIRRIPERLLQQTELASAEDLLLQASGEPSVISLPLETFHKWFSARLSRSFNIVAAPTQASQAVRLAPLIDQNEDGGVSRSEIEQGRFQMRFRDLDDDQTFSAAELMPLRDPRTQQAAVTPDVANLPFVQLSDADSINQTSARMLKQYGDGESLSLAILRVPADVSGNFDQDQNGRLDAAECRRFLETPAFHVSLRVLLSDRSNASQVQPKMHNNAEQFCAAMALRRGRMRLVIDEMPVEIRVRGGGSRERLFFKSFLLQRMSLYDKDKNNYLTADEFPEMQQQMAQQQISGEFEDVDLNGDEMLFREELSGFIERDTLSTQSRIDVSVRQDGKTLFSLLDQNADRRLTMRELKDGFETLREFDTNDDERLMESELGTTYILEFGLGQAEALRIDAMRGMNMAPGSTDAVLPGVSGLGGPEWFRRMDRNQDRDVSRREFLGPRQIFTQLDVDADGLLSAAEAESLQSP